VVVDSEAAGAAAGAVGGNLESTFLGSLRSGRDDAQRTMHQQDEVRHVRCLPAAFTQGRQHLSTVRRVGGSFKQRKRCSGWIGLLIDYSLWRTLKPKATGGMDTALAYLISASIICFGAWIVALAENGSALALLWMVIGLLTVAVGGVSLQGEIRNSTTAAKQ
jgi:hypothetical protein